MSLMTGFKILKFRCVNVNLLVSKILYGKHWIDEHKHKLSVVAVSEASLVPLVSSSFVSIDEFHVVCGDCSESVRKHGCCLYVGNSLSSVQIEFRLLNVAAVLLLDLDMHILAVYRPSSSLLQNETLISFISSFCVGWEVIILRDFYLPSLDWSAENVIGGNVSSQEILFFNSFSLLGSSQWIKEVTCVESNNILDLVASHHRDGQN